MATNGGERPAALGGTEAWLVWAIAVAFVVYYFSFQTGYAIVNSVVQKDVGLTVAQVGLVAAVYTWVFAFFQFFSGALLDRLGSRRVLLPSILLVAAGVFIFANATNFESLLLSQLFVAIGACSGFVGAGYVGGKWFGLAQFSFMFGLVQFAASLFSAFNQNMLNWALTVLNWRDLFNTVGAFGILLFFLALLKLRDPVPPTYKPLKFSAFLSSLLESLWRVARIPHIWVAATFGSLCFGVMLALGVVWAPKLLMIRGLDASAANTASSSLWLGLAAGCFVMPWVSDELRNRRYPIIVGIALQLTALLALLYMPSNSYALAIALCFMFGFGNSAHMLAFSTASDVVEPQYMGTSAAIVNGMMFLVGGFMISRPGVRIGAGLNEGLEPASVEVAQFASRPLLIAILVALIVSIAMRETYPSRSCKVELSTADDGSR